jgi:dihydrofolate reductase
MITGHVFIATSLDGFIARTDGKIDWLLSRDAPDEDHGYQDFIKDMDGLVMGRGSFEGVASFEPWPYDKPVVVLSKTLASSPVPDHLAGRVRFLDMTPKTVMEMLAKQGWRRVYVDGGQIVQSFLREGLIADMVVTQVPVLIGEGRSLFGPISGDIPLTHVTTQAFPSGLVQSRYRIEAAAPRLNGF